MRNPWIVSIILVFILFIIPIFPHTWLDAAGLVVVSICLGLAFAWVHRLIRKGSQGKRGKEVALGVIFIPMIGVAIVILAVIAGLVVGAFSGVGTFQESVSQIDPNDPVAQGNAPLLAIPSLFEGGLAGLSVFWYGLVSGCLASVIGIVYALIYPWLAAWVEKSTKEQNEVGQ